MKLKCECGNCSTCKRREKGRRERAARREDYNAYMRDWYARNANKVREQVKRYRQENLERVRATDRDRSKTKQRDPLKEAARRATRYLHREPCQVCGRTNAEAHHEDYAKPLDVVWLCREHHMVLHRTVAD